MNQHPDGSYKVAIVGAGGVGAAIAYATLIRGVTDLVALYDIDRRKADAEVADLRHGLQFVPPAHIVGGDSIEFCTDADVLVITAGAKQRAGQTRLELASTNQTMCEDLVPRLLAAAPRAVVVVVTNPVDVLTHAVSRIARSVGVEPAGRVLGSGTVLDTSRLRILLAERLGVAVANVHATIAGEHGDSEIALWSSATVGGVPLRHFAPPGRTKLTDDELHGLLHDVRTAAYRIIEGKGATTFAIGLAAARILAAIRNDERAVLPVSSVHSIDGVGEVCLSLPSVVGRKGVLATLPVTLDDDERAGLLESARTIAAAIASVR